jgi:hypothetical protein
MGSSKNKHLAPLWLICTPLTSAVAVSNDIDPPTL